MRESERTHSALAAARNGPLARFAPPASAAFRRLPPVSRFILRLRPVALAAAGEAFGVLIPEVACRAAVQGARAALWLGPDEWLLLAPAGEGAAIRSLLEQALRDHPHSLVDVSHRQVALEVSGPSAGPLLNSGCPLDLDPEAFPTGQCTRTVLAKAEIILWRTAADTFRVEVSRSFAAYVWHFVEEAGRGFRA